MKTLTKTEEKVISIKRISRNLFDVKVTKVKPSNKIYNRKKIQSTDIIELD